MDKRDTIVRVVAGIIDYPSVYMGGPSQNSMRKAEKIISYLENSKRLKESECTHEGYAGYKSHGLYCHTCDQKIAETQKEAEDKYGRKD